MSTFKSMPLNFSSIGVNVMPGLISEIKILINVGARSSTCSAAIAQFLKSLRRPTESLYTLKSSTPSSFLSSRRGSMTALISQLNGVSVVVIE